jgi:hypothetical protein
MAQKAGFLSRRTRCRVHGSIGVSQRGDSSARSPSPVAYHVFRVKRPAPAVVLWPLQFCGRVLAGRLGVSAQIPQNGARLTGATHHAGIAAEVGCAVHTISYSDRGLVCTAHPTGSRPCPWLSGTRVAASRLRLPLSTSRTGVRCTPYRLRASVVLPGWPPQCHRPWKWRTWGERIAEAACRWQRKRAEDGKAVFGRPLPAYSRETYFIGSPVTWTSSMFQPQ